ncbi:MAG: zinc ribbon domain-containing protein [Anaerovoracaceae bacterium]|jgi:hypothetical protein
MKCRKCGHTLGEDDQFCSRCGARVIREPLASAEVYRTTQENKSKEPEEEASTKYTGYTPPEEEFDWKVTEFHRGGKPTEEVNFDWNTADEFHRNVHSEGDEIAFAPEPEEKTGHKYTEVPSPWSRKGDTAAFESDSAEEPAPEKSAAEELQPREGDITGKELERELFGEMEKEREENRQKGIDDEILKRQTAKIDKFYTFNRKNEEFQDLLDREYEKYRSGEAMDEAEDRSEVMGSRGVPDVELPEKDEELDHSFFEEKSIPVQEPQEQETAEEQPAVEAAAEPAAAEEAASGPAQPAEEAEKPQEQKGQKGEETGDKIGQEQPGQPPVRERKRMSRGKKAGLTILAVIIIIVLILVAVRLIAPDSSAARGVDRIPAFFSGEQKEPQAVDTDRSQPAEDLTGVIQDQLGNNEKEAILEIRYNAALRYDSIEPYKEKDIKKSKPLENNLFYKDGSKKYYLDDAIVGAAIKYASSNVNKGDYLDSFELGEIRKGEKGYYIWVSENDVREIYRVTAKGHRMEVTEVYEA